jgi:hypothetical protein
MPACRARRERLVDAVRGVVVGERQQLDAGAGRRRHDGRGRERAVRYGRVGLQVEADGPS